MECEGLFPERIFLAANGLCGRSSAAKKMRVSNEPKREMGVRCQSPGNYSLSIFIQGIHLHLQPYTGNNTLFRSI